jgi:hypothetical protein
MYLWKRFSKDPITKFLVHDHETSRSSKELAHFSESYLVTSENEYVKHNVLGQNTLDIGIVVFFGIGEVRNVLTFTQFLRRAHLLLEVRANGHSRTSCTRVSHQVYNSGRQSGYLSHRDGDIERLSKTTVLSLIDVNMSLGSQISDAGKNRITVLTQWHDEAFIDV